MAQDHGLLAAAKVAGETPNQFIREHHNASSSWQKVRLRGLEDKIEQYKGEQGFEQITEALGILRPVKERGMAI